ncbi:MAG: hypothetical protein GY833_23135 [Aestuariibacter sp.]|nr:hypothetical protein [Aestuariibacter sp.]
MSRALDNFEILATECETPHSRKKGKLIPRMLVRITDYGKSRSATSFLATDDTERGLTPAFYMKHIAHENDFATAMFRMSHECSMWSINFRELVTPDMMDDDYEGSDLQINANFPCYLTSSRDLSALCSLVTFPDGDYSDFVSDYISDTTKRLETFAAPFIPIAMQRAQMAWMVAKAQLNIIDNLLRQDRYASQGEQLRTRRKQLLDQVGAVNGLRSRLGDKLRKAME